MTFNFCFLFVCDKLDDIYLRHVVTISYPQLIAGDSILTDSPINSKCQHVGITAGPIEG